MYCMMFLTAKPPGSTNTLCSQDPSLPLRLTGTRGIRSRLQYFLSFQTKVIACKLQPLPCARPWTAPGNHVGTCWSCLKDDSNNLNLPMVVLTTTALVKFTNTGLTSENICDAFGHKCAKSRTVTRTQKRGSFGHNNKSPWQSANVGRIWSSCTTDTILLHRDLLFSYTHYKYIKS